MQSNKYQMNENAYVHKNHQYLMSIDYVFQSIY